MSSFRQLGNDCYRSAQENVPVAVKKDRLTLAVKHYNQALQAAADNDNSEKALCLKNIGVTQRRLLALSDKPAEAQYHAKEALSSLAGALKLGSSTQPTSWKEGVQGTCVECFQEAWLKLHQVGAQEQLCHLLQGLPVQAQAWFLLADQVFKLGVTTYEQGKVRESLQLFHDCERPLREAEGRISGIVDPAELHELHDSIYLHICLCEGKLQLQQASDLLQQAASKFDERADVGWDMLWDCVYGFHHAIFLTHEHALEAEAEAHAHLGRIYSVFLHNNERAKVHCGQAISLLKANLFSRLSSMPWFQFCLQFTERLQKETREAEEAAKAKSRQPYLDQLKPELDALKAKGESAFDFLRHIYATHPPKGPDQKLVDPLTAENVKKAVQSAILHYHPDKQPADDRKWCVLTEEITKTLNYLYGILKGV